MRQQKVINIYNQTKTSTTSPVEWTIRLLQECMKTIEKAKEAMMADDIGDINSQLKKAQQIMLEIAAMVNLEEKEGENLFILYDFIHRKIIEANVEKSFALLDEIEEYVCHLYSMWKDGYRHYRNMYFKKNKI
ncbi:flagellar protein FliS [Oikeobacillus pervagus]|uniref:Flagellar protein FliS n=1 Tax=Oikeobacillus pervagus TaxID=1325931 RepID=A0AAJ1WIY8_9BACI|nr:flagellar export chaperone FliS [Oikeobacillus pervagus]MDQ0214908.1 flagellar protein FliS [Oikeobacillus pervagus]